MVGGRRGAGGGLVLLAGCGSSSGGEATASTGGTVNVGVATTLSGTFAALGQPGLNGIKLAINQLNQNGGLLGKKLHLITADDQIYPSTGATVTRGLILNDHVQVLFGSVSSAVALAQEQLASATTPAVPPHGERHRPDHPAFQRAALRDLPKMDMEPAAAALAFVKFFGKGPVRIATITPDYSFGLDTVWRSCTTSRRTGSPTPSPPSKRHSSEPPRIPRT